MEREELDQIPWSQLAVDADDGVDRRWYVAGVAVGIVVMAVLGVRLLAGSGGQPDPAAIPITPATDATSVTTTTSGVIVTEASLRSEESASALDAVAVAEWFVMDLYTVDGSAETVAAIRDRVDPSLATESLEHDDPAALRTFVEWARAFDVTHDAETASVSVAYRMIRDIGGSYERDPVVAVAVDLTRTDGRWTVGSWPRQTVAP